MKRYSEMKRPFRKAGIFLVLGLAGGMVARSQRTALVNDSHSTHVKLHSLDMGDVQWTTGFWAERFEVCRDSMLPHLWATYTDPNTGHALQNFEIAAGMETGKHIGPPFQDGDFYKLLEGMASLYAVTKDPRLDSIMDRAIAVIARSQLKNGYIHTPTVIEDRMHPGKAKVFGHRLDFETYNMGHLMTAACVHYRATGKRTLLDVAIRAADYLAAYCRQNPVILARSAICPAHYMGLVELYRTTGNPVYLQLADHLIHLHGTVGEGTDQNQDRIPFLQQTSAIGHAVRANYLYAGAADVYAETGDDSIWHSLENIWDDVAHKKIYVTGGCGALYDGVAPMGTSYNPADVQEIHQAYGQQYQLPNAAAHNETCAAVGNLLWNWRMFLITGQAKYTDMLELELYNGILSGISLDGNSFFYTNPLSVNRAYPYDLRWSGGRQKYISLSDCCPPNAVRTIAEASGYAYSINAKGLWVNLYGGNTLSTRLVNGEAVRFSEETDYPWDGKIVITVHQAPDTPFSVFLRIPGWCRGASLRVNGRHLSASGNGGPVSGFNPPVPGLDEAYFPFLPGQYAEINHQWKAGDVIELDLPMPVTLVQANPLVEANRNQVAVKRGPVVYCLESPDVPDVKDIFNVSIPVGAKWQPSPLVIGNSRVMSLEGTVKQLPAQDWNSQLYQSLSSEASSDVRVRLIPYYAWANRGSSDMTVWMPVDR
jgi:DUF1680 family protein